MSYAARSSLRSLRYASQKLPAAEKDTKNFHPPIHSRQQGHLAWDSFYDPSEISLLFYKVVILLHMHVCYLTLVSQ